ncbi:DUF2313 domain-containing protein [Mannheimia haemolytica]|nr:DUF2313 domain-containing protein [Mannheimia haemolytica]
MAKNMKVQLELTAKDTASPVLNQAAKTAEKAFKNTERAAQKSGNAQTQAAQKAANATESSNRKIEQSYRNARRVAADVSRARETLGVRAENAIQREIEQTRAAYDRLKRSGVASQNELRRASEATKQRVRELNAELGKTSFGDKAKGFGRGLMSAGVGIAAGAAMARQPAKNQMEFDRQLAMASNTAFSDRDVKGRIEGKKELLAAVQEAVKVGGGTKEDALLTLDTLKHGKALGGLLPPVSYDPNGRWLALSLEVEGRELDRIDARAKTLIDAVDVSTGIFIDDWERVCGLTANSSLPLETRIERVIAKLNQLGGLSIGYITQVAKELGYCIKISEPQPFIAGLSRAGDMLWHKDIMWTFFVDVCNPTDDYKRFRASVSMAGDALMGRYKDPILESLLEEVKPAFSRVWVRYLGDIE